MKSRHDDEPGGRGGRAPEKNSPCATIKQLRNLWAAVLGMALLLVLLTVYTVRLGFRVQGMTSPRSAAVGADDPGTSWVGSGQSAQPQGSYYRDAALFFQVSEIRAMEDGQQRWLETFIVDSGLSASRGAQLRGVLVRYMESLNEIRLMEVRGAHTTRDSPRFYRSEYQRLQRALQELLGQDLLREFNPLLEEQNLGCHIPEMATPQPLPASSVPPSPSGQAPSPLSPAPLLEPPGGNP